MLDNTKGRTPCGRQYSRVIRWVNRAQSMSAGGKYSDAILDVECARAELDDARQELLLCHKTGRERKGFRAGVFGVTAGFCAVFFIASPLEVGLFPADGAQWQVYAVSRSSLMRPRVGVALGVFEAEAGAEEEKKVLLAGNLRSEDLELDSGKGLSEDEVFRLMEVGRRALQRGEDALVLDFN